MYKMIFRRLALCLAQLLALSLLVFVLTEFMPGDALTGLIGPNTTGEKLDLMRRQMGLDKPPTVRYLNWLTGILHGDFGVSYNHKLPVLRLVGEKFGNTLRLGLFSLVVCFSVSIPLGVASGRHHGKLADKIITSASYGLMAVPQAVFGIISVFVFSYILSWLPFSGSVNPEALAKGGFAQAVSRLRHMILPGITSAMFSIPVLIQLVRAEVIANQNSEYISSLRSRGLSENRIFRVHILRNSMIPTASLAGSLITAVLSGTVIVETIFSYPGIGKLFVDSITQRDYPTANFIILLSALIAVMGTLFSDILMNRLDPRVRMI